MGLRENSIFLFGTALSLTHTHKSAVKCIIVRLIGKKYIKRNNKYWAFSTFSLISESCTLDMLMILPYWAPSTAAQQPL